MKTYSNCPVCNHSIFNEFLNCKDYTVSKDIFKIDKCANCDFTFTNPIPLESEIGKYYESEDYISHSNTSKGLVNSLYQAVRNITLTQKVRLLQSLSNSKRLLDIGSGTGEFLNTARNSGFIVSGVEPSIVGRKQAKENFSLDIDQESELNQWKENSFDFISMWHVLEHVYNLNDRIKQIHRLLDKNGHLIVAVPNLKSYDSNFYRKSWAAFDVPRHLYHFSPKDISTLFSKHGFELSKTLPMKFDSYYVSMLSEKYKNGKSNLIKAFFIGLLSNLKGDPEKTYSSQIYILTKKAI